MNELIKNLHKGLIVSCQARPGNPLRGADHMAAMAQAAELGGAVAIRADGPSDIAEIKKRIHIPVIGIYKTQPSPEYPYITPDFEHAEAIAKLGVEIIALDATLRPRPDGTDLRNIATFEEGVAAAEAGVDLVATTLSGYTTYSPLTEGPDLELIRRLKAAIETPIIAEGRFTTPRHFADGIHAGAHAVVIGKAITNVQFTTNLFIKEAGL